MALAIVSGIGTLTDAIVAAIIAWRLREPAKSENYKITSFRGSFFWFFAIFVPFVIFMSGPLFIEDPVISGYGYTIGHIFLYLSTAAYIFAPFDVIAPERKKLPKIIAIFIVITMIPVTIINWMAYANGTSVPVYDNNVALWNPPDLVSIYIPLVVGITYIIFGFGLFFYHSIKTQDEYLRKRSRLLAIGFLILGISGPIHDQKWGAIAPIIIGFADLLVALAFIIIARAVLLKKQENTS